VYAHNNFLKFFDSLTLQPRLVELPVQFHQKRNDYAASKSGLKDARF
jgi:hypothetical protein